MKLTKDMKRRIKEMESFAAKVNAVLAVHQKMEIFYTGGKSQDTFDLRTLNANLIKSK